MHALDNASPSIASSSKYISDRLVVKELWRRKQTSPSGSALGYRLVYCHNSLTPVYNYYIDTYKFFYKIFFYVQNYSQYRTTVQVSYHRPGNFHHALFIHFEV